MFMQDKELIKILPNSNPNYSWITLGGKFYEGEVVDIYSNVLIVKCTDGVVRAVEGD